MGGIALAGKKAPAEAGASKAATAALRTSGTALAAESDVVSLEEDMARMQAGRYPRPHCHAHTHAYPAIIFQGL